MTTTTFQDVLEYLSTASLAEIEQVYPVLKDRAKIARKVQASLTSSLLKPGDKVRLGPHMSPKYLAGAIGVVDYTEGTKVHFHFEEQVGRYSAGYPLTLSADAVTRIDT